MARFLLTQVRFILPAGVQAPHSLADQGAVLSTAADRDLITFAVDLTRQRPSALEALVRSEVELGDAFLRRSFSPTANWEVPLHEQLEALFGQRRAGLRLAFYLTGAGWGAAVVASHETAITVSCSYLEHALGDLISLGISALEEGRGRCAFEEEPGQYRWVFANGRLTILLLDDTYDRRGDDAGETVFEAACSAAELGRAALRCADDVELRYGIESYAELWVQHAFPSADLKRLRALVSTTQ